MKASAKEGADVDGGQMAAANASTSKQLKTCFYDYATHLSANLGVERQEGGCAKGKRIVAVCAKGKVRSTDPSHAMV